MRSDTVIFVNNISEANARGAKTHIINGVYCLSGDGLMAQLVKDPEILKLLTRKVMEMGLKDILTGNPEEN